MTPRIHHHQPVVVTGLGLVTPLGHDVTTSWSKLLSGVSACSLVGGKHVMAPVTELNVTPFLTNVKAQEPRFIGFALKAVDEALRDAKLQQYEAWDRVNTGVVIGTGMGGATVEIKEARDAMANGKRLSPFFVPRMLTNSAAGHVSIVYGLQGPNLCPSTACASGAHAIVEATRLIERGDCDVVICGGTESSMDEISIEGFNRLRALSGNRDPATASRPFDSQRDGFIMGEGCGILVLESLQHATKRAAPNIYARIAGCGMSSDAYHFTASSPQGSGAELTMRRALKDGGNIAPNQVQYVNAHATSTPLGDAAEVAAMERVFGSSSNNVVVSSVKGSIGHLLGAAGAAEAVFTILAMCSGRIPPNLHLETLDPKFAQIKNLEFPNSTIDMSTRGGDGLTYAISNSFGFGGTNVSILFDKNV